jgi:hypothetical protein
MPNQVDPNKLSGKAFTRKAIGANDYSVLIDGLTAGRIMQMQVSGGAMKWLWTIGGRYLPPELQPTNGQVETLEQAQEAFQAKFWQWHTWTIEQGPSASALSSQRLGSAY